MKERVRFWLPIVLVSVAGAGVGAGAQRVADRLALERGPSRWRAEAPDIPVFLAALSGPPLLPGEGWSLGGHSRLTIDLPKVTRVDLQATVPPYGHLEVGFAGSGADAGVALVVDRGETPYINVFDLGRKLAGPGQSTAGRSLLACEGTWGAVSDAPFAVSVTRDAQTLTVAVNDAPPVRCAWSRPTAEPFVLAGIRRVGLSSLSVSTLDGRVEGERAPGARMGARIGWAVSLAVAFGVAATLLRRRGARGLSLVAVVLPLWAVWPASGADLLAFWQHLRVVVAEPLWTAVTVPVGVAAGVGVWLGVAAAARRGLALPIVVPSVCGALAGSLLIPALGAAGMVGTLLGAALGAVWARNGHRWAGDGWGPLPGMALGVGFGVLTAGLAGAQPGWVWTYAGAVGALAAGVVWLNVRRPWGMNLLSLVFVGLMVVFADQGLRWTDTGDRLTGRSARAVSEDNTSGTFSSFAALEHTRVWSTYPRQDYPVRPPDRRTGATRVVALGGSSTGGAWQNDNLDEFWPAAIERMRGPTVQAVNLGVGGWTTLHIRRFVETRLADIDPDVVVLYVGHNDILTQAARPWGQLYQAWLHGGDAGLSVSTRLARAPLYQLLRFVVQGRQRSQSAVPVADARSNVRAIADALRPRAVPMLLVREGVVPDPSVLNSYGEMLESVASESPSIGYLDASKSLVAPTAGNVFLDNCHLTHEGHSLLAALVGDALVSQGWLGRSR